jgi:hypothetical protein
VTAAQGKARPLYLEYRRRQCGDGFEYLHAPLEEALANAYAYNALGFISRIKAGYKTSAVRAYQEAIKLSWRRQPEGYKYARFYIQGDYIPGGAHLLAQILGSPEMIDLVPLSNLATHVMPSGFTALMQKPDIPTYLVGSDTEILEFIRLVPTPNEAYTQLFWPYDTEKIDNFIQEKKREEKLKNKQKKPHSTDFSGKS